MHIRAATPCDSDAVLDIYKHFIEETAITFETEVPSACDFRNRVQNILNEYPFIVCEDGGRIAGYAYASRHRERAAFRWSVDLSVYVDPAYHRRHIATALYTALFGILKKQGFATACAAVTYPNRASEAFHEALGFRSVGIFENIGYKMNAWWGVQWFQRSLTDHVIEPRYPVPFDTVTDSVEFADAVKAAENIIN